MSRILQFLLFFIVFMAIYFGMHAYVFFRLSTLLSIGRTTGFYIAMALFSLSYIAGVLLEKYSPNWFTRFFYALSATWMGILFLFLCTLLVYEVIRLFVSVPGKAAGMFIILFVLFISLYALLNAYFVHIKTVEIPVDNLEKEVTIVQLSDIHVGTIRNSPFIREIVEKTNSLNPDMVLITGDLVDGTGPLHPKMFDGLNKIKAKTFFVLGNHEVYEGVDKILAVLNTTKMTILRNEVIETNGLQIVGIDYVDKGEYIKKILPELNISRTKPSVLMTHGPWGVEYAAQNGITLQISGHTHKGQIFPFSFFSWLANHYLAGIYRYDGTYLYVSQGTGTWGPPMRLGSRNEITLIKLHPKN